MKGKVVQVIGPVVDVHFDKELPQIYDALIATLNKEKTITLEVALHLGDHVVRTIALEPTEGLKRDAEVTATGAPIQVPVCDAILGRMFNVLG